jgi:hypothetical protein
MKTLATSTIPPALATARALDRAVAPPGTPSDERTIDSLQIGMNWFSEHPGGLDRMVDALVRTLPAQGVRVRGLVAGSANVRVSTDARSACPM